MPVERLKELKEITIEYEAPAGATLEVLSDLPSGSMAVARTIALPATTTSRQSISRPLDIGGYLEGRLIQFRVTSTGIVKLFKGFVRLRVVGTYFDGSKGEKWETQPLSFA
jgi:hypothetical protein